MVGRRLLTLVSTHKKVFITTIFGLIAGPIIGYLIIQYITISPSDLVKDLENGDISKFNEDRKQIKQQIVFEGIDLSETDLAGAELSSAIILHSDLANANLSDANLENADLSRANLSGADLSRVNLDNSDLLDASLVGANLSDAYLRNADLSRAFLVHSC